MWLIIKLSGAGSQIYQACFKNPTITARAMRTSRSIPSRKYRHRLALAMPTIAPTIPAGGNASKAATPQKRAGGHSMPVAIRIIARPKVTPMARDMVFR